MKAIISRKVQLDLQLGCFQFKAEHTSGEKAVKTILRRVETPPTEADMWYIVRNTESTK